MSLGRTGRPCSIVSSSIVRAGARARARGGAAGIEDPDAADALDLRDVRVPVDDRGTAWKAVRSPRNQSPSDAVVPSK